MVKTEEQKRRIKFGLTSAGSIGLLLLIGLVLYLVNRDQEGNSNNSRTPSGSTEKQHEDGPSEKQDGGENVKENTINRKGLSKAKEESSPKVITGKAKDSVPKIECEILYEELYKLWEDFQAAPSAEKRKAFTYKYQAATQACQDQPKALLETPCDTLLLKFFDTCKQNATKIFSTENLALLQSVLEIRRQDDPSLFLGQDAKGIICDELLSRFEADWKRLSEKPTFVNAKQAQHVATAAKNSWDKVSRVCPREKHPSFVHLSLADFASKSLLDALTAKESDDILSAKAQILYLLDIEHTTLVDPAVAKIISTLPKPAQSKEDPSEGTKLSSTSEALGEDHEEQILPSLSVDDSLTALIASFESYITSEPSKTVKKDEFLAVIRTKTIPEGAPFTASTTKPTPKKLKVQVDYLCYCDAIIRSSGNTETAVEALAAKGKTYLQRTRDLMSMKKFKLTNRRLDEMLELLKNGANVSDLKEIAKSNLQYALNMDRAVTLATSLGVAPPRFIDLEVRNARAMYLISRVYEEVDELPVDPLIGQLKTQGFSVVTNRNGILRLLTEAKYKKAANVLSAYYYILIQRDRSSADFYEMESGCAHLTILEAKLLPKFPALQSIIYDGNETETSSLLAQQFKAAKEDQDELDFYLSENRKSKKLIRSFVRTYDMINSF